MGNTIGSTYVKDNIGRKLTHSKGVKLLKEVMTTRRNRIHITSLNIINNPVEFIIMTKLKKKNSV